MTGLVFHSDSQETSLEPFTGTEYWILKSRNFVWQIMRACTKCKLHERRTYNYSFSPPDLQPSLVSANPCFTFMSENYAESLQVRNIYAVSSTYRAIVFLIAFSLTRGIWLELVPWDGSAACIRGLCRFFRQRGTLRSILSNKDINFTSKETAQFICSRNNKLNFIPHATPWRGGVNMRIIRYVKYCFKQKCGNRKIIKNKTMQN